MLSKVLFIGLIFLSPQLFAENYKFKPGLWEITTTSELVEIDAPPEIKNMMQQMSQMPKTVDTECITDINSLFDAEPEDAEECKTTLTPINSSKILVEMLCKGEDGTSTGAGEMNLKEKSFISSLVMTSNNGPIKIKMKMKVVGNGKYIGACR